MTESKLEPICRLLAAREWDVISASDIDLSNDPEGRIASIERSWRSWMKEAREIVQALLDMADRPPVHLMASYAQSWLRFLLDEEKSLSQKMHEAGFAPRKQGKVVREDE